MRLKHNAKWTATMPERPCVCVVRAQKEQLCVVLICIQIKFSLTKQQQQNDKRARMTAKQRT